jgi:hypothetical protein
MPRANRLHISHRRMAHVKTTGWGTLLFAAVAFLAALPAAAVTRVTVDQLEQSVAVCRALTDKDAAQRLSDLELSERLSKPRFERLNATLPGDRARLALLALADSSAFLNLPQADLLKLPAPDVAAQGRMVSQAADFVVETVSRMPDFLAAQTTTRFEDMKNAPRTFDKLLVAEHQFNFQDREAVSVAFRNGREVKETLGSKKSAGVTSSTGLTNWGVFGPLLGVVMADILKGKIGWGHWEEGERGPLAVFRYAVPEDRANYTVRYCCFRSDRGEMRQFEAVPAYHGEIAIEPGSGAVMRLVLKMDLQPELPMQRADQEVEYGPVEIGGKTYICPLRSISITSAEALVFHGYTIYADKKGQPDPGGKLKHTEQTNRQPHVTAINDVVFADYHQFRGEVRMLSGEGTDPDAAAPASPGAPAAAPAPPHAIP